MSVFDNGEYFSCYSAQQISFRNRRASQAEFDHYWKNRKEAKEEIPKSIQQELALMPTVEKAAGIGYYEQLHRQLFDSFCKEAAKAMKIKSHDPAAAEAIPAI